jgi:transcriptional regulator with XRE-family HTH domain
MITSAQIRAARGALRWSAQDLADRAGVGIQTVKRFELASGVPRSRNRTLDKVRLTLEAAGVEFVGTPEDRPGIRLRR